MIHVNKFNSTDSYEDAYFSGDGGIGYVKENDPWLSYNTEDGEVNYNKSSLNPQYIPLTIKAVGGDIDIFFKFDGISSDYQRVFIYSIDGGDWESIALGKRQSGSHTETETITLDSGSTISIAGDYLYWYITDSSSNEWIWGIKIDANGGDYAEIYGNIMSLTDSTDFYNKTEVADNAFSYLFAGSTGSLHAENLVLPATILGEKCYMAMFDNCSGLIDGPKILPAPTLTKECYEWMFDGCSSLIKAPEIMADWVDQDANDCCMCMFRNCTVLKEVQDILFPNGIYGVNACVEMFQYCTSLEKAPELPSSIINSSCYSRMFDGCTSLKSAPTILPATTLDTDCYYSMFKNCTSLERAPELPATTLVNSCYRYMFEGCTKLHYVKCMATSGINSSASTNGWLKRVRPDGVFIKNGNTTWPSGISGIPQGWHINEDQVGAKKQAVNMWVDDYPDMDEIGYYIPEDMGTENWDHCLDYILSDPNNSNFWGANRYEYTGESIEYDGDIFYLWEFPDDGYNSYAQNIKYALTKTIDYDTLYNISIEHNHLNRNNPESCPIWAFLGEDKSTMSYDPECYSTSWVLLRVR